MLEKMHVKENTALTTSGDVEMKGKIIEESNITATSAISQTSSISSTSSIISIVADTHQVDDSESTVPSVIDCASSSQSFTDSLALCPSLTDGGSVSHDAEDRVTPMEIDPDCVVQDLEQNAVDSDSLGQYVPIASVATTHIVIDTGSVSSTPSLSESVSSTQSVTEVGHSVTDSFSSSSVAVEEASVVPLGVTLTNSFSSNGAAVDASVVPLVNSSVDALNASDSAVETDDSFEEEMVIDTKDIKQELDSECEDIKQEIDSEGEDTVDGHMLNHLLEIDLKVQLDNCCSLKASFGESDASMRQRLFTNMSQSFPGSALSRILLSGDTTIDSEEEEFAPSADRLSSSCFGSISLDKEDDDDLTSLEWLQKSDLLKDMNDLDTIREEQKENAERQKSGDSGGGSFVPQTHPCHVPYNPQKHVNSKPPYSFSCLIFMAVEESPGKKLPVKDIYNWILTNFPYFQNAPLGWKNSVRHNLSLNKCFKKVEKDKGANIGKGSLWCIDPDYRPNLLQALRKTPYHPYQQLQMMSSMVPQQEVKHVQALASLRTLPLTQRPVPNTVSPHLFPFLSRRLAQTSREAEEEERRITERIKRVEAKITEERRRRCEERKKAIARVAELLRDSEEEDEAEQDPTERVEAKITEERRTQIENRKKVEAKITEERRTQIENRKKELLRDAEDEAQQDPKERDRDVANILLSMGSKNTSQQSDYSNLYDTSQQSDFSNLYDSSGMSSDASDASGPTCLGSRMKRKAGPPKRQGPFIITPYPNSEHTYSSLRILEEDAISGESSIDNEYDFGDEDDISELSDYPSDWDEESGDEVDGDIPQPPPRKKARLDMTDDVMLKRGAQLLMSLSRYQPGASDTEGDKKKSPEKSSQPCSKSLPRSTKFHRSSSASPLSRKSSSTAATKSSSLSSSLSSTTSSSSSVKKPRAKPVSRSTLKTKLFSKRSTKSAAASKKSSRRVSSKTAAPSKTVGASGSKTATRESTSSSSSKKSEVSKTPVHESSKKLDSAATPPSAKPASKPVSSAKPSSASSSTTKASIIMTRRGKAAAEQAAAEQAAAEQASAKAAAEQAAAEQAAAEQAAAKAAAALGTKSDASASATKMDTSASGTKPNAASASQTKSETSASGTKSDASASQTKSSASGKVTAFHRMRTRGKKLNFS